jgi:N-methylhydantoinase B
MNNVLIGGPGWVVLRDDRWRTGWPLLSDWDERCAHRDDHTKNTPVEALERAFPMRVSGCGCETAAGGGRYPGGEGIERDLELELATISLITERRWSAPWGIEGESRGAVRTGCCREATRRALSCRTR